MTRANLVAIIVVATICCPCAGNPRAEERPFPQWPSKAEQLQIVEKAKKVSAQALDASQPAVLLEQWLTETLGPEATLEWEVGDCDLKPEYPQPADGYPMCVAVRAGRPTRIGLRLHVLVGTFTRGVFGSPTVAEQSFMGCSSSKGPLAGMYFLGVKTLSDISQHINILSSRQECR